MGEHPQEKSRRFKVPLKELLEWLGVVALLFFALSASRVDIISILGFENLLGPKSLFASDRDYLFKILANLLGATILSLFVISIRERTRRLAEVAVDAVTVSTAKVAGNSDTPRNVSNISKQEAIISLTKRIATLSLRATTIYWTMILALITGVFLIIFAGYLSSFDTNFSNLSSKIESDRQDALQTFGRFFAQRGEKSSLTLSPADNNAFDYAQNRVKAIDANYTELLKAMIHQTSERGETKPVWNWPSTILRVGVIGLLVFLTQILISLYRYNSRLIAFYGSRRDALLLCGDNLDKMDNLAELMFPATLDFGREPRHPFQELSELIRRSPKTPHDAKLKQTGQPTPRSRNKRTPNSSAEAQAQ